MYNEYHLNLVNTKFKDLLVISCLSLHYAFDIAFAFLLLITTKDVSCIFHLLCAEN